MQTLTHTHTHTHTRTGEISRSTCQTTQTHFPGCSPTLYTETHTLKALRCSQYQPLACVEEQEQLEGNFMQSQ